MKIHSDYVVRTSASEQISNERAGLSNPLSVADLGLKGWRFRRVLPRDAIGDRSTGGPIFAAKVTALIRL